MTTATCITNLVLLLVVAVSFLSAPPHLAEAALSTQLVGDGTESAIRIIYDWANSYQYVRDDVLINYQENGPEAGLAAYYRNLRDFVCTDRGISGDLVPRFGDLLQLPLYGQPLALVYNVDGLGEDSPNLVLDRETLGLIWAGEITQWNDQRIKDINTEAVSSNLPAADIYLTYGDDHDLSMSGVFKAALSSFSGTFRSTLEAANNSFALLPPALDGRLTETKTSFDRAYYTLTSTNSLTYTRWYDALTLGVRMIDMVNRAGHVVAPNIDTVQSAMDQFQANFSAGQLTIDIVDAPGDNSWPLSYITFISFNRSSTALDCTDNEELLRFIAWTQINDPATVLVEGRLFVPLEVRLRTKVLNLLTEVQCNQRAALDTSYVVGAGPSLPVFTAWAVDQSTSKTTIKYYEATSLQAKQQLASLDEHFGATIEGIEPSWFDSVPDLAVVPAAAYAVGPAFNLPGFGSEELVLDVETIAGIYLGTITRWNDTRIRAINSPAVGDLLPEEDIVVVTILAPSEITLLLTTMLSAKVPAFAQQVGTGLNVTFPLPSPFEVEASEILITLALTDYSFGFANLNDVLTSPIVRVASMYNNDGMVVRADSTTIQSAVTNYVHTDPTYTGIILSGGAESWPLAAVGSLIYRSRTMADCNKAKALADYMFYSQIDSGAQIIAQRRGFAVASLNDGLRRRFLNQLKEFKCDGVAVSSAYGCINDGRLCSDAGLCTNGICICDSGREGQYCESFVGDSSDSTIIAVAVAVPVSVVIIVIVVGLIVLVIMWIKHNDRRSDDWEIDYRELELGEVLGTGGYGEVYRALWKGTEVAVKLMAADKVTKDMERSFQDEVRVMTSLRHPNVVLFMAASTKPPKMCIVMEFMALGSLYDLLHNELIPDIPFQLKAKMAYQASKGMHFLHSSGIVHRDLKSLNLLLDNKWNVKVSDFGLTKFKEDVKSAQSNVAGTVHWTAPEVLNESGQADLILADVYAFGIILWELLTRQQPYFGMSPAAVAVAVIRDGIRPPLPDDDDSESKAACPFEYKELITNCWHSDPVIRPTFLEIMTRLSTMHGDSTSDRPLTSKTSSSSSPSLFSFGGASKGRAADYISTGSSDSASSASHGAPAHAGPGGGGVRPPEGEVAIVFSDITRAATLWEFNAAAMRDATILHNCILRGALKRHRGYEVAFLRDRNSGEGSFCMAFQEAVDALAWCCEVQQALLDTPDWPAALLEHPSAAEELGDGAADTARVVYRGLRVRMGVHVGTPKVVRDSMTRRVEYIGPVVNTAARITAMTHGGQIVMSHTVHEKLLGYSASRASGGGDDAAAAAAADAMTQRSTPLGKFEMPDAGGRGAAKLFELKVEGLEGRFFGGVTDGGDTTTSSNSDPRSASATGDHHSDGGSGSGGSSSSGGELQTTVGDGLAFKEDTFLTSANLCRWIIAFSEIQMGEQVGLGSYGVVSRGKWKGVEVAVKRFIKQKLDERRMLEFRAEMAFLSELHHPNIVLFIGACVKKPNLCIVTEFMKRGSLKEILADSTIKLAWKQKLGLLRSAALGINYLHSLEPVIVHRDLKPSNLLVDENWNVKVADFGFARIKEENATMTRCGTPCWTAPEVIRGEKYNERADVFSFGVIMWQVVTRREPFAGRNFMGVSLDVLEGKRPQIPGDCNDEMRSMLKKCWHGKAAKRPSMEEVVNFLDAQIGDGDHHDALGSHV